MYGLAHKINARQHTVLPYWYHILFFISGSFLIKVHQHRPAGLFYENRTSTWQRNNASGFAILHKEIKMKLNSRWQQWIWGLANSCSIGLRWRQNIFTFHWLGLESRSCGRKLLVYNFDAEYLMYPKRLNCCCRTGMFAVNSSCSRERIEISVCQLLFVELILVKHEASDAKADVVYPAWRSNTCSNIRLGCDHNL